MDHFREDDRAYFIDFEYGGFNYLAYDIANHFNEHTGTAEDAVMTRYTRVVSHSLKMSIVSISGVDAVLDHSLFPDRQYQIQWLTTYIKLGKAHDAGLALKVTTILLRVGRLTWSVRQ